MSCASLIAKWVVTPFGQPKMHLPICLLEGQIEPTQFDLLILEFIGKVTSCCHCLWLVATAQSWSSWLQFNFQVKKTKNISHDTFGTKFGRVHMQRQDFSKLQIRKMKGLKRLRGAQEPYTKKQKFNWSNSTISSCVIVHLDQPMLCLTLSTMFTNQILFSCEN